MALSLRTGIAPSVWEAEHPRAVATAWELLKGLQQDTPTTDGDGRQMSG